MSRLFSMPHPLKEANSEDNGAGVQYPQRSLIPSLETPLDTLVAGVSTLTETVQIMMQRPDRQTSQYQEACNRLTYCSQALTQLRDELDMGHSVPQGPGF